MGDPYEEETPLGHFLDEQGQGIDLNSLEGADIPPYYEDGDDRDQIDDPLFPDEEE
jgi:hypothetical protein